MPVIKTLEHTTPDKIVEVFNESFSDYIVPLKLSIAQLENKIQNDGIRLRFSPGAFEGDRLVGFILHGYDMINNKPVIYNAGTGVIPSQRGQKLTSELYSFILPILRSEGVSKIQLEVITGNLPAIRTYQNTGFQITRTLNCYKGSLNPTEAAIDLRIRKLEQYDWPIMQSFWDWLPSWQNSITAAENLRHDNLAYGIYTNETLLGYIIYNPLSKRVQQFAVHKQHRRKGIGSQLFHAISHNIEKEIAIINVEEGSKDTDRFLASIGLNIYVKQYEMELRVD